MASGDRGGWRGWSQTRKGFELPSSVSGPGPGGQWGTWEVQAEPSLWLLQAERSMGAGEQGRREADGTIPMEEGRPGPGQADAMVW